MPSVNRGRHTLVPEIPRTHHIGRSGSSMHLVNFDKWFHSMQLFNGLLDWKTLPLDRYYSQLSLHQYKEDLVLELNSATSIDNFWEVVDSEENTTFTMCYDPLLWSDLSQYLGLWPHIPLEGLPTRGLTFEGVTRFRWTVSEEVQHTVLLVSRYSPLLVSNLCIWEEHLNSPLPPSPRLTIPNKLRVRPSGKGKSCSHACASRGMWCSPDLLPGGYGGYLSANSEAYQHVITSGDCPMMVEQFGSRCMGGCVAVENEKQTPANLLLPCLWHDGQSTTCLISPIKPSSFDCSKSSPDASRLCPCTVN
jgi:hypothetical protein